jgi:PAP2 superfamily
VNVVSDMAQSVMLWLVCCVPGVVFLLICRRRSEVSRLVFRLAPVSVFYFVYSLLIAWTQKPAVIATGMRHALAVYRVERTLHIAWEPRLSHITVPGANWYYGWAQVVVTLGLLTWLAINEGDVFWRCARNALALIAAGGFLVFWLFPMSPPWLLPASYGIHSAGLANLKGIGDLLGAMPSLHTAWAGWAALILWAILPGPVRWLGFVNLLVTGVVVLTTGNHFVLDIVAGEALAFVACVVASRLEVLVHGPLDVVAPAPLVSGRV